MFHKRANNALFVQRRFLQNKIKQFKPLGSKIFTVLLLGTIFGVIFEISGGSGNFPHGDMNPPVDGDV